MDKWWNCQLLFGNCQENCSDEIYSLLGLDLNKINQCVNQSFTGPNPLVDDNLLLSEQKEQASDFDVEKFPSIFINEDTRFDVSIISIFSPQIFEKGDLRFVYGFNSAICAAYRTGPSYCKGQEEDEKDLTYLIGFLTVLIVGVIVAFQCHAKRWSKIQQTDGNGKLNSLVTEYFALGDEGTYTRHSDNMEL